MNPDGVKRNQKVMVCLGDSITYGFPYGPESSWVRHLHGKIAALPLNCGVNGDTTSDMLRRLPGELSVPMVTHVHILGGTNDAWLQVDPARSRQCVESMVQMCIQRGVIPILGLTTPVCMYPAGGGSFPFGMDEIITWLNRHRQWLVEYAAVHSIPLIDYFTPLCLAGSEKGDPRFFLDEAHLSREGNKEMYRVAEKALEGILQDK